MKEREEGIVMLKASTLIAIIGTVIYGAVQLDMIFHPTPAAVEDFSNLRLALVRFSFLGLVGGLLLFFVVFFIKLSATRK